MQGYVYLITSPITSAIKIGRSRTFESLLKRYVTAYGPDLSIYARYVADCVVTEKRLHAHFKRKGYNLGGELFQKQHAAQYVNALLAEPSLDPDYKDHLESYNLASWPRQEAPSTGKNAVSKASQSLVGEKRPLSEPLEETTRKHAEGALAAAGIDTSGSQQHTKRMCLFKPKRRGSICPGKARLVWPAYLDEIEDASAQLDAVWEYFDTNIRPYLRSDGNLSISQARWDDSPTAAPNYYSNKFGDHKPLLLEVRKRGTCSKDSERAVLKVLKTMMRACKVPFVRALPMSDCMFLFSCVTVRCCCRSTMWPCDWQLMQCADSSFLTR